MATQTQVMLTCDVCGDAKEVQTRTLGLDGKTYEVDLCPKDSKGLSKAAAGYVSKARGAPATRGPRRSGRRPRSRAGNPATTERPTGSGKSGSGPGNVPGPPRGKAGARRTQQRKPVSTPKRNANATSPQQQRGVFVYGIFPEDIEVTTEMPGVGENPGLMRAVRSGDLAAVVSEVDLSGRLGSPDDLRIHREILDASAPEVPVLALPFGTVLTSEQAAEELLAAHRDEFTEALQELEGRAQFVVQGRYLEEADPTSRQEDTRTLEEAMEGHCVASIARKPTRDADAVRVAFLVDTDQVREVEQAIQDLAREWDGRVELQLLGPMAAYDFVAVPEVAR
jgi:hypothetical protein